MFRLILLAILFSVQYLAFADTTVYESTGAQGEASFSDKPTPNKPVEKVIDIPDQSPQQQAQGQERYKKTMEHAQTDVAAQADDGETNQTVSALPPQEDVPQTFDEDDWPDDYGETYIHTGTATGPDRYHYYHPYSQEIDDRADTRDQATSRDNRDEIRDQAISRGDRVGTTIGRTGAEGGARTQGARGASGGGRGGRGGGGGN